LLATTADAMTIVDETVNRILTMDTEDNDVVDPSITATVSPNPATVGETVTVSVVLNNNDYWNMIMTTTLVAGTINLVTTSCPADYKTQLATALSTATTISFKAFRYMDNPTVQFSVSVKACVTASAASCVLPSCPARKRRQISHFMDQVLRQSHPSRRSRRGLGPNYTDESNTGSDLAMHHQQKKTLTLEKNIKFKLQIRDPARDGLSNVPNVPGVMEIGEKFCIPRGTGVAILVSMIVLMLAIIGMSTLCYLVMRRRNLSKAGLLTESLSTSSLPSKYASKMSSSHHSNGSRWEADVLREDYVLHNNNHRSSLIDNDHLSVVSGGRLITTVIPGVCEEHRYHGAPPSSPADSPKVKALKVGGQLPVLYEGQ
jgi:hypothetical protein